MSKVEVVSRSGRVIEIIDREVRRIGTKGKRFMKLYVTYKNKRYIAYPVKKYFVTYSIFPWGK